MNTMSHFGHKPIPGHAQFGKTTRTAEEARDAFEKAGVSISAWAKAYGFRPSTVAAVLRGKRNARIGKSHQIALALGIKTGVAVSDPREV